MVFVDSEGQLVFDYSQLSSSMKFEVSTDYNDSKAKQILYKDLSGTSDLPLEERQFEVISKPNLRIYCSGCELELTRHLQIISKNDYHCVSCFCNLEELPSECIVRPSLKASPSGTQWDFMDEAILTHSIYNRGYSNWTQVKEFMDYNQSPFSLEEINLHYEKYHYNQPEHTLIIPAQLQKALPHTSYGQTALRNYEQNIKTEPSGTHLNRKDSKCQKKPSSNKNIPIVDQEGGLKPSVHATTGERTETEKRVISPEDQKNQSSVLGYNAKRDEFDTWYFDLDAEKMLDELQFYESDTTEEHAIKISMIEEYNKRLDERAKRKAFVLEYKLLDTHFQFSLKSEEQKASLSFQPFMRYSLSHADYNCMIDTFTTLNKQQSFISNLMRIRNTLQEGQIGQAHQFLLNKRRNSIQIWEKNYNKCFPDKRRRKVYCKNMKEDGTVELREENMHEECPVPLDVLQIAVRERQDEAEGWKLSWMEGLVSGNLGETPNGEVKETPKGDLEEVPSFEVRETLLDEVEDTPNGHIRGRLIDQAKVVPNVEVRAPLIGELLD